MSAPDRPELPLNCLRDLVRWFNRSKTPGVIMGGVAASLLGRPRATRDVDALVMVPHDKLRGFLRHGRAFGFEARGDEAETLKFAGESNVLLLCHRPTDIEVDVVLGALPFERGVLRRRTTVKVGRVALPVISAEDLIVMKATALRPRDWADIAGILENQPDIDVAWIRRLAREFAVALERPEIVEELERLLAVRRVPRRRKR